MAKKLKHCDICQAFNHETKCCPMLTCSQCGKIGHIKIDCRLKTKNSWVILVPKDQKTPKYLEAFKENPRKTRKTTPEVKRVL